jgi:hypothetical protein
MAAIFTRSVGDYQVLNVTIAASAATSDVADLGNHCNSFALCMPSEWTDATLSILVCPTVGGTYNMVVGATGSAVSIPATVDMIVDITDYVKPYRFIRLESSAEQEDERVIQIMVK